MKRLLGTIFSIFICCATMMFFQNCSQVSSDSSQVEGLSTRPTLPPIQCDFGYKLVGKVCEPIANPAIAIAEKDWVRCAVMHPTGQVKCKGFGSYSGFPDTAMNDFVVIEGITNAMQVVTAQYFGCALLQNRTVKCWGANHYGQLGNGTQTNSAVAVEVSGLTNIEKIDVGSYVACALKNDGTVWCWGRNDSDRMIPGAVGYNIVNPFQVVGLSQIMDIKLGSYHYCALTSSGYGKCWGDNGQGQLGAGHTTNQTTVVDVVGLNNLTDIQPSRGTNFTCARNSLAQTYCWGHNNYSQLGVTPAVLVGSSTAVLVEHAADGRLLTAGTYGSCFVDLDDRLRCWGDLTGSAVLYDIASAKQVSQISYSSSACVLFDNGEAKCYGTTNSNGSAQSFF